MARKPSKARVEGSRAAYLKRRAAEIEETAAMIREDKARIAAEAVTADLEAHGFPNPVPGDDGEALDRITEYFKAKFPDEWAEWQNTPLQYGLEAMAGKLKG